MHTSMKQKLLRGGDWGGGGVSRHLSIEVPTSLRSYGKSDPKGTKKTIQTGEILVPTNVCQGTNVCIFM